MKKLSANQLLILLQVYIGIERPTLNTIDLEVLRNLNLLDNTSNITEKGQAFINHCKIIQEEKFKIIYE